MHHFTSERALHCSNGSKRLEPCTHATALAADIARETLTSVRTHDNGCPGSLTRGPSTRGARPIAHDSPLSPCRRRRATAAAVKADGEAVMATGEVAAGGSAAAFATMCRTSNELPRSRRWTVAVLENGPTSGQKGLLARGPVACSQAVGVPGELGSVVL